KGSKVKLQSIEFEGNHVLSDAKLRRTMKTKQKFPGRFWKRSKFVADTYKEDKEKIIKKYKSRAYRDARILYDSITQINDDLLALKIGVEEGEKYYFGDISFLGNNVYSDAQLNQILRIKKGDLYNGSLLEERIADNSKPDADDITNLYQNSGYLFSQINPVETRVYNDTIDFEIRINEGKMAHFDHVYV